MKVRWLTPSSRTHVAGAIKALDDLLDFVNHAYTDEEPMIWEHLDIRGGADALLWFIQRGLKARDDDFAQRRPPMQFAD